MQNHKRTHLIIFTTRNMELESKGCKYGAGGIPARLLKFPKLASI